MKIFSSVENFLCVERCVYNFKALFLKKENPVGIPISNFSLYTNEISGNNKDTHVHNTKRKREWSVNFSPRLLL
jgi:hypothetical protein